MVLLAETITLWFDKPVGLAVLPAVAILIALLLALTARQHRQHARETAAKLCNGCGLPHPPYAQFCRHCGSRIEKSG
jgi:ribosomal protein L40E